MDILVVDPVGSIGSDAEGAFRPKGWHSTIAKDRGPAFATALDAVPDAIVVHGDGRAGETTHLCQRLKHNPLTAGIPIVLVEDAAPPAWLLAGMPADAFTHAPFDPSELIHHIESLAPQPTITGTGSLDDLTNCPRRRSILAEMDRRLLTRELFGAGLLTVREAEVYRQDFGRSALDQFVVLVSVVLRRHAASGTPVSIGYLDDGVFLVLGAPSTVHHLIAQTIRDFEALIPAYYEMDTLFGSQGGPQTTGPLTWVSLQGGVCLVEPGRYDNVLQVGFVLAETLTGGHDALRDATTKPAPSEPLAQLVAD